MSRAIHCRVIGAICCAVAAWMNSALAIETTYGEDPVPNSKCYDGFINLGYGIDPIPAKSPYVRWQEWRAAGGLAPTVGPFKRQVGESRFKQVEPPLEVTPPAFQPPGPRADNQAGAAPTSRRNARTRNLPSDSRVR